jgi:predicted  nucleic acid-binding Zn-ribbon protein
MQDAYPTRPGWWARLRQQARHALKRAPVTETTQEAELRREVSGLRKAVEDRDRRILALRAEVGELKVEVEVKRAETQLLYETLTRYQVEVRASTARNARRIAEATEPGLAGPG